MMRVDGEPTADEIIAGEWWKALSAEQREYALMQAGQDVAGPGIADAWEWFKREVLGGQS